MGHDFESWPPAKVCGALRALFDARCFGPRTLDNVIMYDHACKLEREGTLTMRQIDVVRSKLPRYAPQLVGMRIKEIPVNVPDGTSAYRYTLHNPSFFRVFAPAGVPIFKQVARIKGSKPHPDGFLLVPFSRRNAYVLTHNGFMMDERARERLSRPPRPLPCVNFDSLQMDLKPYQREGVQYIFAREGRMLLADEQGLGKTAQAIAWAFLSEQHRTCIVCPASLKLNWKREVGMWTGETDVYIAEGRNVPENAKKDILSSRWIVINYDILDSWLYILLRSKCSALVFDEVQALKNGKTKKTKAAHALSKKSPHILALSGTPVENRPSEFWPLINMIDPMLFPSKVRYSERYCDLKQNDHGSQDITGASNTKELHKILSDTLLLRRKKADVLQELPEKQRAVISVAMSTKDARNYARAENDFRTWVKSEFPHKAKATRKAEAIVKIGVLKKLAAMAKLPLVFDWIDTYLESTPKLVVFAHHHAVIDELKGHYGKRAVVIDGRVPASKRQAIRDQFQDDPEIELFIGNIKAAGSGLTLTAARDTLTVELVWTSTAHDQCEDRVHRIGQRNAVIAYYMLCSGTIDERIAQLLDAKRTVVTEILDGEDPVDTDLLNELLTQFSE